MTYSLVHVSDNDVYDLVNTDAYQSSDYRSLSSEECINLIEAECKGDPRLLSEIISNLDNKQFDDFEEILNLLVKVSSNHINFLTDNYDPQSQEKFKVREFILADFEKLAHRTLRFLQNTGWFDDSVLQSKVDDALANPFLS